MPASLQKIPLDEDLFPIVLDFDCRVNPLEPAKPWEDDVNRWIKAEPPEDGARLRLKRGDVEVYLYFDECNDLVGYGSIGASRWPDPTQPAPVKGLPKVPISLIPSLGIQTRFHGDPAGASSDERYSTQIVEHLKYLAWRHTHHRRHYLGLYVHPENERAIRCYRRLGFEDFHQTWHDKERNIIYQSMILKLQSGGLM